MIAQGSGVIINNSSRVSNDLLRSTLGDLRTGNIIVGPEGLRAVGMLTCSSDDALYVALDEGTKAAPVEVVYARSFYAGSSYPSGPLSGNPPAVEVGTVEEAVGSVTRE